MATVQKIYEEMQRMAPLELAESWDNPGLLVDCGGEVSRVLVALDVTAETLAEAEQNGCQLIVTHHPVIFHPLKKLSPADLPFQLVQKGISAICMHTNLDAAEGGVNEVLAGIFGMKNWEPFAGGCGRVGEVEPITVPELARKARVELGARCNTPLDGPEVPVKYADTGKPVRRLAVISGAGGGLFEEALAMEADCLLTGEADHHDALDAKRLGLSIVAASHYATEFPVAAAVAQSSAPRSRLWKCWSARPTATRLLIYNKFIIKKTSQSRYRSPAAPLSALACHLPGRGSLSCQGALGKEISFSLGNGSDCQSLSCQERCHRAKRR
ncbi:MAG: Nif3-like dinuclear metal center hexameric protein [Faecalibacterium prausnitzii]